MKIELALFFLVLFAIFYVVLFIFLGRPVSGSSLLTVLGLVGNVLAGLVLILTSAIDRYSADTYLKTYFSSAKQDKPGLSPEDLDDLLLNKHGQLKDRTKSVLKVDVGATLSAVSTFLALVGILVKGV